MGAYAREAKMLLALLWLLARLDQTLTGEPASFGPADSGEAGIMEDGLPQPPPR